MTKKFSVLQRTAALLAALCLLAGLALPVCAAGADDALSAQNVEAMQQGNAPTVETLPDEQTDEDKTDPDGAAAATPTPTLTPSPTATLPPTPSPTPSPTPAGWPIPCLVQAEDYDGGGEGTGYHDTTGGNSGGYYRGDGVDISKLDGAYIVTGVADGEWLRYTVGSSTGGPFWLTLRTSAMAPGRQVRVLLDGNQVGQVQVPADAAVGRHPVVVRVAFKPTSSILTPVPTINRAGEAADIITKGRHDPCVGIRAVPVGEAMVACVLADAFLRHRGQVGR